jgi:hypothetical protein
MRNLIFEKHSSVDKAWMVSDSCIQLFDVDKAKAREDAKKWWTSEGTYNPQQTGSAVERLDPLSYQSFKDYAVLEAGRGRVVL